MMDYAKSKDCILQIHASQNEHQWSINDSWSCVLDNLGGDRLYIVIYEVFAVFTGQKETDTLPASA
jgi:hypothetical protein